MLLLSLLLLFLVLSLFLCDFYFSSDQNIYMLDRLFLDNLAKICPKKRGLPIIGVPFSYKFIKRNILSWG